VRAVARRGRRARGCAEGRTPALAARPLSLNEDDTRLGTSPANWGIKKTTVFHWALRTRVFSMPRQRDAGWWRRSSRGVVTPPRLRSSVTTARQAAAPPVSSL